MKTLNSLKREATQAVKFRNHDMTKWLNSQRSPKTKASAICKKCNQGVWVNSKPAPNDIDIAGEAIALDCTK